MSVFKRIRESVGKSQYGGLWGIFSVYWKTYGGFRAVLASPYFHFSLLMTVLLSGIWAHPGWWQHVIDIIPSVLGFSLGGYAIWLAIGDENFKRLLAGKDNDEPEESSPYMDLSVAFVHFIFVQFLALTLAILALGLYQNWPFPTFEFCVNGNVFNERSLKIVASFFGFLMFIYSLATAVAATFQILRYSVWYDDYQTHLKKIEEQDQSSE